MGIVVQQIKLLLGTPASHIKAPGSRYSYSVLLIHLPANELGKVVDGPSIWVTANHVGDLYRVVGSWLWLCPGPGLIVVDIWGVNYQMKDLSLPFCHSAFQVNE